MLNRIISLVKLVQRATRIRSCSLKHLARPKRKQLDVEQLEVRTVPSLSYLGNELQVGQESQFYATDNQAVATAIDSAGTSIVVWSGTPGLMGQLYDSSGTAQGAAIVLQPETQSSGSEALAVAVGPAGNFVVAWFDYRTDNIEARVFSPAGLAQGNVIAVADLTSVSYPFPQPQVVMTPTGFAVFSSYDDTVIHGSRYDPNGKLLGTIAVNEAGTVYRPRAGVDGSGNFVVAYSSGEFAGQLFAQRLDPSGNAVGNPIQLSVTSGTANNSPSVAVQAGGTFAAAWENDGDTKGAVDSGQGVYIRVFNADGTPQADPLAIDSRALGGDTIPAVAMDSAGNFVVAWQPFAPGPLPGLAQVFGPTGVPQGTPFAIRAATDAAMPAVAMTPTGSRIVVGFVDDKVAGPASPVGADLIASVANHAPVVDTTVPLAFTYVKENDPSPKGDTVGSVFGAAISDVDLGPLAGIAVSGVTAASNGAWQYSLDSGKSWTNIGAVAENTALLVRATDRIRFVPNNGFLGTANLTFHAWDQTSGAAGSMVDLTQSGSTGGSSAFSTAKSTASLYVTPTGNYAPVLDTTYAASFTGIGANQTTPAGNTVAQVAGPSLSDRDGDPLGIAVTAVTGTTNGTWQYSLDSGNTWTVVPAASLALTSALVLRSTDMLRFVPNTGFLGTVTVAYRAWDQTQDTAGSLADSTTVDPVVGAAGSAFSTAQGTASATVARFVVTQPDPAEIQIDVYGTTGNDTLLFTPGSGALVLDGEEHDYSFPSGFFFYFAINVVFHGGGNDSAYVDMRGTVVLPETGGGREAGSAEIGDGFAYLSGPILLEGEGVSTMVVSYGVRLDNVPNVYISGAPEMRVLLDASATGPTTFVSTPTYSYFSAPNRFDVISGVGGAISAAGGLLGSVYAYGNHAATDTAYFYGPTGLAAFVASGSAYSYMSSTPAFGTGTGGRFDVAVGFGVVYAYPGSGDNIAYFLDSPGNDVFYGDTSMSYMYGPGYFNEAAGFALTYAESFVGGVDYAYNYAPGRIITGGFAGIFYRP